MKSQLTLHRLWLTRVGQLIDGVLLESRGVTVRRRETERYHAAVPANTGRRYVVDRRARLERSAERGRVGRRADGRTGDAGPADRHVDDRRRAELERPGLPFVRHSAHQRRVVVHVVGKNHFAYRIYNESVWRVAMSKKGKGSPYSTAERRVPELIPVLGSQPADDVSHKPGGRLPLLTARPAVTVEGLRGLLYFSLIGELDTVGWAAGRASGL